MADIEKKNNQSLDVLFTPEEYKELLLQAVAVIESARCRLARQAAATTNDTYWRSGLSTSHPETRVAKSNCCRD